MASSITQDCIRQVSTYVAEAFKPDGFRRQAPHLWRERGDVINVINFQASQWGSAEAGRFTINLASTNRHLYSTWTGRKFPANPAAAIWPVHIRIGALTSGTDLWWDVEESTDAHALAEFIVDSFRKDILTWFETYPSLAALDAGLSNFQKYGDVPGVTEAQVPLIRAIIKHHSGDLLAAERGLAAAMVASNGTPFAETVSVIAARLNAQTA